MACSHSPEALTSLACFTESLSLALGFLARSGRLTPQSPAAAGAIVEATGILRRRFSLGRRSSRGTRRRSSTGASSVSGVTTGRRKSLAGGPETGSWSVTIDLRKVDALLTMLKQLDDQESAGHLISAANHVGGCTCWGGGIPAWIGFERPRLVRLAGCHSDRSSGSCFGRSCDVTSSCRFPLGGYRCFGCWPRRSTVSGRRVGRTVLRRCEGRRGEGAEMRVQGGLTASVVLVILKQMVVPIVTLMIRGQETRLGLPQLGAG